MNMTYSENIYHKIRKISSSPEYAEITYETSLWLYAFAEAISADHAIRVASDEVHIQKDDLYIRIREMNPVPRNSGYKVADDYDYGYAIYELISERSDTILEIDEIFRCLYGDVEDVFKNRPDKSHFQLTQLFFDFKNIAAFMRDEETYGKNLSAYKIKHGKRKFSCSLIDRMKFDPFKFGIKSSTSGADCRSLFHKLTFQ